MVFRYNIPLPNNMLQIYNEDNENKISQQKTSNELTQDNKLFLKHLGFKLVKNKTKKKNKNEF